MKIFFVGDFKNDTGPGIANKLLRKGLGSSRSYLYSEGHGRIGRVFEIIWKTLRSDCVCMCSASRSNALVIRAARLLHKPAYYVMHGYQTFEQKRNNPQISGQKLQQIHHSEAFIFKHVNKVFCVSKKFMEYMKQAEPEYADKFDYHYNGVDLEQIEQGISASQSAEPARDQNDQHKNHRDKNPRQIVSIGGGMPQKNNLTVCRSIDQLNREKSMALSYIVIGLPYTDKEEICSYEFVRYYDHLPHERVLEILAESGLYIQNSSFETFGLAVVEALLADCSLLLSEQIGMTDLLGTLQEGDRIANTDDPAEIAEKIERLIKEGNAGRLKAGLETKEIGYRQAASGLVDKITAAQVSSR
ncbi:glycosyltransferase family 4 protein [Paenibacillus pinistramenti]|uniref:glycosyltransferase family 4 protein n=1 Tax=Paenibacillus pinistramenti TaxID=1768003 RepID=UPI00139688A0|nr:glycosyltransferase family 4 protein [Paenibacillus pinistramenti]